MADLKAALAALMTERQSYNAPMIDEAIIERVITTVADGDGMYSDNDLYYLKVGYSALQSIFQSLVAAGLTVDQIGSVCDYACGFGRVARWLRAAFPNARFNAADLDPKATRAVSQILAVETTSLDIGLSRPLPGNYDLIWIGSLLTHLAAAKIEALLRFLKNHITASGVIVATTHGDYVAQRLISGEKTYNLAPDGQAALLADYRDTGFGFSPYPRSVDYGISVVRPQRMNKLLADCGFRVAYFNARGWASHQDVYCLVAIN
jgi:hypothetical protein